MKKISYYLTTLCILLTILSCDRQVNQTGSTDPNTGSTGDTNNGDNNTDSNQDDISSSSNSDSSASSNDCYADGVGDSSNNYITISPIIGKGKNSGTIQWSSKDDPNFQGAGDQEIFLTDSRLNIRVLANPSPGQGATTSTNEQCQMMPINYQKLQIKVGIKVEGAYGHQSTHIFDDISVNGCSEVHEFSISQSSEPFIIEILEAKWDYSCTWANEVNDSNVDVYCPMAYVWENDCFSVGLQIATDHTRDIPH